MNGFAMLDGLSLRSGTVSEWLLHLAGASALILIGFASAGGLFVLLTYLFSLPMQRRERTRLFLDLVEGGLRRGQSIEHTIAAAARSGDRSLGNRFQQLARLVQQGLRFEAALASAPDFLPPETSGLLRAGCESGDLLRILPACRAPLHDGVGEVAKAHHYFALLAFVVSPAWVAAFCGFAVFVAPKFRAIAEDLGAPVPAIFNLLMGHYQLLVVLQVVLIAALWSAALIYVGGPRFRRWMDDVIPGVVSWLGIRIPWRRQRMQRDFSAALAALLDAGVPEARAVRVAAEAGGNDQFAARASRVMDELARGVPLPAAAQTLDDSGELRWRLSNGRHGRRGFTAALEGWHQALEARAFHHEQVFAQVATTGLVFLNGAAVLVLALAVFQIFTSLIQEAVLW